MEKKRKTVEEGKEEKGEMQSSPHVKPESRLEKKPWEFRREK